MITPTASHPITANERKFFKIFENENSGGGIHRLLLVKHEVRSLIRTFFQSGVA